MNSPFFFQTIPEVPETPPWTLFFQKGIIDILVHIVLTSLSFAH